MTYLLPLVVDFGSVPLHAWLYSVVLIVGRKENGLTILAALCMHDAGSVMVFAHMQFMS